MSKTIKNFCKTNEEEVLSNLDEPIIFNKKTIEFVIERFSIPKKFNISLICKAAKLKECFIKTPFQMISYEGNYKTYINSSIGNPTHIGSINFDYLWIKKQCDWLKTYINEPRVLLTLYSYTDNASGFVNSYLLNNMDKCLDFVEECINNSKSEDTYFPLYFDLIDIIKIKSNEDLIYRPSKNVYKMLDIIRTNIFEKTKNKFFYCKENYNLLLNIIIELKTSIILEAVNSYIKFLSNIIKKAPKTTKEMFVYRRTNTQVLKHSDTSITFPNFTSTSLAVEMTEEFGQDDCCLKMIIIPKNASVLAAIIFSANKDEYEILLNKKSKFSVKVAPSTGILQKHGIFEETNLHTRLCFNIPHNYSVLELIV